MEIDKQNNLWIGTNLGIYVGSIGKENFRQKNQLDRTVVSTITTLYCDPKGGMWIGTVKNGKKPCLFKFIASDKDISTVINNDFKQVTAFSGLEPTSLVMDSRGVLWVGTYEGLFEFRNDSVISKITVDNGLLSNIINLLSVGKDGSIYIGTNSGLNRYFPESKRIFSYTERNGFPGILTRHNAVYESPAGNLWFGTANGATRLIPDKLLTKELEPLTHILSMRVNYETEPREMIKGMKLKYNEGSILFDYYSICLTNPDVVRYQVKLEGADIDWQPVTDQPRANYPALAFGKYTFMVKACNSQGVWNSEPATFSFVIKPPFYFSWWFILLSLCAIVISVISYIKIREKNLIREKIILEKKVKERTAEVVQKSQIIEEKNRDITASIRYAERIQRAMLPRAENYAEIFVLYMPKDIVSGDFYWMYDNGDNLLIAAVDCTGHGVPGAFMSIIGHNSLNKVVGEYGLTRPSAILDQLNAEVNKAILQSQEKGINDGMDLTLISYHKKTKAVELAGAYNPLYQVRNGEVIVHKTDRFPIGMHTFEQKRGFTNFQIDIQPGDMLYMASDGYADQFGSPDVKKFKTINLKRILSEIWNMPVTEQKIRMEREIMEWKGDLSQVDDIMIIGMRIPG
jgi:serine phosphatase RsbU (regulator of sigma subunit)